MEIPLRIFLKLWILLQGNIFPENTAHTILGGLKIYTKFQAAYKVNELQWARNDFRFWTPVLRVNSYIRGSRILTGCFEAILEISSPCIHIHKLKGLKWGAINYGQVKSNDYNYNLLLSFIPGGPVVRNLPANAWDIRDEVRPGVRKISLRRKWQPTSGLLPGEFEDERSVVGYSP